MTMKVARRATIAIVVLLAQSRSSASTFRNSDLRGTALGHKVGEYVSDHGFQPVG